MGVATVVAICGCRRSPQPCSAAGFTDSVPVTVMSPRAGLVMNPDAKVQDARRPGRHGRVASRSCPTARPRSTSRWIRPSCNVIPANVHRRHRVRRRCSAPSSSSSSIPPDPSPELAATRPGRSTPTRHGRDQHGRSSNSRRCCPKIDPPKLNETLGAIASALNGRGEKIGQMLPIWTHTLAKLEPSLPALSHDSRGRADGAARLRRRRTRPHHHRRQREPDQRDDRRRGTEPRRGSLVSVIGLADIGNDVIGTQPAATHRRPAPSGAHHRPAQRVQPGAVLRAVRDGQR